MASDSQSSVSFPGNRGTPLIFAVLFSVESLSRSFNASVLSIQAYDILGSTRYVSILTTCVSLCVLSTTLMMPWLLGKTRRRWTYTLGGGAAILAAAMLATHTLPGQILGSYLRNAGAAILNVTLSLYIMDHIKRSELAYSEPLRLTLSTFSWMLGPTAGIWLYTQYGPWVTQVAVAATSVLLLGVFWFLRLRDPQSFVPGTLKAANPINHVRRFARQPRLRLAWLIALGRSCFWSTFFIYGPLLLIEAGKSKQFGGLIISASQALLLMSYVFGKLAQKSSVRLVISLCLAATGLASFAASLTGYDYPLVTAGLFLMAAFFCTGLDAVGGIPFLRAVRPYERQSMSAVYRSFIDMSELVPGFIYAIALTFYDTQIVFGLMGAFLFVVAGYAWHFLPKSM